MTTTMLFVLGLVIAINTNIEVQAFQSNHYRYLQKSYHSNKLETAATRATASAITILRGEATDGDDCAKPSDPLSSLIGGLGTVPVQRPKIVAGAGDYDKAEVRSMVETWIKDETVLILSTSTCPYCDTVKELFRSKGVPFRVENIDGRQDVRAEMAELIGRTSVPAVFVDGEYIGGCNDGGRGGVLPLQESGELDTLLSNAGAIP